MAIHNFNWRTTTKEVILPLVITLIPFVPNIYEALTEPDLHFIYNSTYTKNPVIEWNRQISNMLNQLGSTSKGADVTPPDLLLRRIGEEFYQALPTMMAGIGFKPLDSKTVNVFNVSRYDLRNIKVHFIGCVGFDSYMTWPDTFASPGNRSISSSPNAGTVTIRYDRLPRPPKESYKQAAITFYGADASQCKPAVEVELANGTPAIGKEIDFDSYTTDIWWARHHEERLVDFAFKLFLALAVLYLYFQIRGIKKRPRP